MKRNKKIYSILILILVFSVLLTSCVPQGEGSKNENKENVKENEGDEKSNNSDLQTVINKPTDNILRTNNSSEPGSLDPVLAQGTHESWILDHTFEGLMKVDEDLKIVPGMAEDYEMTDDGLKYTFKIRKDAKWSNGDPVTAEDFEYSWKRALNPELAADYAYQLYYLKNGEKYNLGEVSEDEVGVKALDEYTLEVELEAPTAYFLELTAFFTLYPVNKNVVEENPNWAKRADTHVSNGPFTLEVWNHDANISLRKNNEYYDASSVKLEGIDFDMIEDENTAWQKYEGGDYDFLTPLPQAVVSQMKQSEHPELVISSQVGTYYYNFNLNNEIFKNVNIRKGLSMTLDRETIVDKIAQGGQIAAEGVVPFGLIDDTGKEFRDDVGTLIEYDLEKGQELFKKGLEEEGLTEKDFSDVVILYNTAESHKKIAQAAQEMWKKALGIDIQIENVDFQVKLDREKAGDFDISRAGWLGDYMDAITFIELWESTSSFNDAKYNNPEYDELVRIAKSSSDAKERFDAMKKAEKILLDDMPVIPVYFYTQPYAQKPYLKGVYKPLVNYPKLTYAEFE